MLLFITHYIPYNKVLPVEAGYPDAAAETLQAAAALGPVDDNTTTTTANNQ